MRDIHRPRPIVGRIDGGCHVDDSGVVDEDVKLREALFGGLDGLPVRGGGHVEAQEVGGVAGGTQFAGVRLARVLEDVAEDDGGALLREAAAELSRQRAWKHRVGSPAGAQRRSRKGTQADRTLDVHPSKLPARHVQHLAVYEVRPRGAEEEHRAGRFVR
jgi:hypothetical protein